MICSWKSNIFDIFSVLDMNANEKNVSRIRKKTFYQQFCMGTIEGHHKSIFNTLKVKKNKDT
jgi:hypothetical protein